MQWWWWFDVSIPLLICQVLTGNWASKSRKEDDADFIFFFLAPSHYGIMLYVACCRSENRQLFSASIVIIWWLPWLSQISRYHGGMSNQYSYGKSPG